MPRPPVARPMARPTVVRQTVARAMPARAMAAPVRPMVAQAARPRPVLAMPAAARVVSVRVAVVRVVTPTVVLHRTPTPAVPVGPRTAALVEPRAAVLPMVARAELVGMPTAGLAVPGPAELVVTPTVERVVPDPAAPVELRPLARMRAMRGTRPAGLAMEPPGRARQRVTPPAVLAVRVTPVPAGLARAARQLVRRLRVEQVRPPVTRTAGPVAQQQVATVGPAEQRRLVPVPQGRAVLRMVVQVRQAVPGRAVLVVPRPPEPVVQPPPVRVVLGVAPLAVIQILPAVT